MPISPVSAALDMLSRESRPGQGSAPTVSLIMDLLYYGEFNIFEQVSSGELFERVNLIGSKGSDRFDEALWLIGGFNSGTEPVPARWEALKGEGFSPRHHPRTGLVHGLGANSKIDIVLKILAASRFRLEELKRPILVGAIAGEEGSGTGVRSLLATGPSPHGVALVGAPTNLELWTDHPGCIGLKLSLHRKLRHRRMPPCRGFYELEVEGRSAHVQRPALGQDAMQRGLDVLATLREHGDLRLLEFSAGEAANRVPGRCRIRVATSYDDLPEFGPDVTARAIADGTALPFPIDALFAAWFEACDAGVAAVSKRLGHARNVRSARPPVTATTGRLVSDRNHITGDIMFWTGPGVTTRDVGEHFANAVQRALIGQDEIEVEIVITQDRPAFAGREGADGLMGTAKEAMRAAGLVPVTSAGHLSTDAGLLRAAGITPLVFGPGRGVDALYRDDEALPMQHLQAAFDFYVKLIHRYCVAEG